MQHGPHLPSHSSQQYQPTAHPCRKLWVSGTAGRSFRISSKHLNPLHNVAVVIHSAPVRSRIQRCCPTISWRRTFRCGEGACAQTPQQYGLARSHNQYLVITALAVLPCILLSGIHRARPLSLRGLHIRGQAAMRRT
jgi:hypothetical protein